MKVYVVDSGIDYEGGGVDGVFSTEEKALAYIKKKLPHLTPDRDTPTDFRNKEEKPFEIDYASVTEYEINREDMKNGK